MPDWVTTSLSNTPGVSTWLLAWRIGMALALGVVVAGIYRWARKGETIAPSFLSTLVLLSPLIAMATQIIGDNVARAFSLVGALSVVRFRTVVKDTQDTAFVIFAVVVGMSAGANNLAVGLVGLAVLSTASLVLWPPIRRGPWQSTQGTLTLRLDLAKGLQGSVETVLATAVDRYELIAAGTARQGSCLDLGYRVRLRRGTSPAGLVVELNLIDGVESVDLKQGE